MTAGWELGTTLGALALSLVGAYYSASQARSARKSMCTAENSARSAEEQARAAKEQVLLMQRQIDGEEKARHENQGPTFEIAEPADIDESDVNAPFALLRLRQTSGPPLASIEVSASGENVEGLRGERGDSQYREYRLAERLDLGNSVQGRAHEVYVELEWSTQETDIHLKLICTPEEPGLPWTRAQAARAKVPPPPQRRRRRAAGF